MFPRNSSISWRPRLIKRRSLVRISHSPLVWPCPKEKCTSKFYYYFIIFERKTHGLKISIFYLLFFFFGQKICALVKYKHNIGSCQWLFLCGILGIRKPLNHKLLFHCHYFFGVLEGTLRLY